MGDKMSKKDQLKIEGIDFEQLFNAIKAAENLPQELSKITLQSERNQKENEYYKNAAAGIADALGLKKEANMINASNSLIQNERNAVEQKLGNKDTNLKLQKKNANVFAKIWHALKNALSKVNVQKISTKQQNKILENVKNNENINDKYKLLETKLSHEEKAKMLGGLELTVSAKADVALAAASADSKTINTNLQGVEFWKQLPMDTLNKVIDATMNKVIDGHINIEVSKVLGISDIQNVIGKTDTFFEYNQNDLLNNKLQQMIESTHFRDKKDVVLKVLPVILEKTKNTFSKIDPEFDRKAVLDVAKDAVKVISNDIVNVPTKTPFFNKIKLNNKSSSRSFSGHSR